MKNDLQNLTEEFRDSTRISRKNPSRSPDRQHHSLYAAPFALQ